MLTITQLKDVDKIMDYTYPKLFGIVPKEMLLNTMKDTYETEEYIIELDSIDIRTISPAFIVDDTSYVKIKHTMLMKMKFKEPQDTSDPGSTNFLVTLMEAKYGRGNVRFDKKANSLNIFMTPGMVGIKPPKEQWTFTNLDEGNPAMLEVLFSKKVLDKLKELK